MKTAVLVDGGFFIKRYRTLYGNMGQNCFAPHQVVRNLYGGILRDIRSANRHNSRRELYRILYYDCPPLDKRVQNPISNKGIDFIKSPEAQFRLDLHRELKKQRKVALRLGHLGTESHWIITPDKTKQLLKGEISVKDLTDKDGRFQ